jgi:hypothetical protein
LCVVCVLCVCCVCVCRHADSRAVGSAGSACRVFVFVCLLVCVCVCVCAHYRTGTVTGFEGASGALECGLASRGLVRHDESVSISTVHSVQMCACVCVW